MKYFQSQQCNIPKITQLKKEAFFIRELINNCDKQNTCLVTEDFPVMNCKISSMLLSYHFLTLWPKVKIIGVGGIARNKIKELAISHYWLEISGIAIDITGDQYNIIEEDELNSAILKSRPFNPVHIEYKENSFLYKLFKISYQEEHLTGFPDIDEDFLLRMKIGYEQLLNSKA